MKPLAALSQLRKLILTANPMTGKGVAELAGLKHLEHLDLRWVTYCPGYRTPAGTGTGL